MTAEGYQALDEDLKRLKTIERPAVIAAIAVLAALGFGARRIDDAHESSRRRPVCDVRVAAAGDRATPALMSREERVGEGEMHPLHEVGILGAVGTAPRVRLVLSADTRVESGDTRAFAVHLLARPERRRDHPAHRTGEAAERVVSRRFANSGARGSATSDTTSLPAGSRAAVIPAATIDESHRMGAPAASAALTTRPLVTVAVWSDCAFFLISTLPLLLAKFWLA